MAGQGFVKTILKSAGVFTLFQAPGKAGGPQSRAGFRLKFFEKRTRVHIFISAFLRRDANFSNKPNEWDVLEPAQASFLRLFVRLAVKKSNSKNTAAKLRAPGGVRGKPGISGRQKAKEIGDCSAYRNCFQNFP
jgi:hypothetical protein